MLKGTRNLCLDVCDYTNKVVCNLYDSSVDISGQATDVFVKTERNGWKELTFNIPTTCLTSEGEEENFRLRYLIADYRLRLKTSDDYVDWYLISEPKIVHNNFSKNVEVAAGHICQLLKTKNLGLEFSDEEGNNVGTAGELLATILEGTGWEPGIIENFSEDDGSGNIKVRSLSSPSKTGAFKLISNLCEKFDAKPIYNGDTRTVDLVPMNPFSEVEGAEVPEKVVKKEIRAIELNYGTNVSRLNRTLDTTNLITRLYAYGAYGDKTTGYCGLKTCSHNEYSYTFKNTRPANKEYSFNVNNAYYYFTADEAITVGTKVIWSELDQLSKSYVYNSQTGNIYNIYKEPKGSATSISMTAESVKNWFDYIMDFSYYEKIGLLTDEMKQTLATFQRTTPAYIEDSFNASAELIAHENALSTIAESNTGFLRLDVASYTSTTDSDGTSLTLVLNKNTYPDGIMYRSDYMEAQRNYFSWYCASRLKDNGDPVSGIGSVVYIVHNTTPQTWEKCYVKLIDGESKTLNYGAVDYVEPSRITLWRTYDSSFTLKSGDRFYLFCTNSNSGRLGVFEGEFESIETTLQNDTKVVTEEHPTYFIWDNDDPPKTTYVRNAYGWYYKSYKNNFNMGDLYFCYGLNGETTWHPVIIADTEPTVVRDSYYFNPREKKLYHGETSTGSSTVSWVWFEDIEGQRLSRNFSKVVYSCLRHDMIFKGQYDKYVYTAEAKRDPGNYAIKSEYGFYWVFTTDETIASGETLKLDTVNNRIYQSASEKNIVKPETKRFDTIDFPVKNMLSNVSWYEGTIDNTGVEVASNSKYRCNNLTVYGGTTYAYNLKAGSVIVEYNSKNRLVKATTTSTASSTIVLEAQTKYVRIVSNGTATSSNYWRVNSYTNKLFVSNKEYTILPASRITTEGNRIGLMYLIKTFSDTADECYDPSKRNPKCYYQQYKDAQDELKRRENELTVALGDIHREGYWQKNDYVEGDENKLYKDAVDNLAKVAKPEARYDVTFLDLYGSNHDLGLSVDESDDVEWPDIEITDAVHLIDEDIGVNCWAFIDKLEKCYDKPWQTKLEINTDLSLIGQKTFTDVMTHIAEVANETSSKQTIYQRAASLTGSGALAASKLEGTIKANVTTLTGGSSNWYTDKKGNIVLESADGQSAMMLTGAGWCVANSKDSWGDWMWRYTTTGNGMTADFIAAGTISGTLIEAGSITTDQINASVGQELDIGSNTGLLLFATTDGLRPSGALKTKVANGDGTYSTVGPNDSYIEITPKTNNSEATINIMTGGALNLQGSNVTIQAKGNTGSTVNISGSNINMNASSVMEFKAGTLKIDSGGEFLITSNNFTIAKDSSVVGGYSVNITGTINATAGNIAGFNITSSTNPNTGLPTGGKIYYNTSSIDSKTNGIYIGTDGVNIGGGRFVYTNSNSPTLAITADSVAIGTNNSFLVMNANEKSITLAAAGTITIASGKTLTIASSGSVKIGNTGELFTIGSDSTNAYIYSGKKATLGSDTVSGVYLGTDGIALGKGFFKVTAAGALTATGVTISGDVTASTGYIGGWEITSNQIRRIEKDDDDNVTGALILSSNSTYPILAGGTSYNTAAFWVKKDGAIQATSATITGTIKATAGWLGGYYDSTTSKYTGGWQITKNYIKSFNSLVGLNSNAGTNNANIAFYAGSATPSSAPFYVTHAGALTATSATITGTVTANTGYIGGTNGWTIAAKQFYSSTQTVGMSAEPGTNNANVALWAGKTTASAAATTAKFYVTHAGFLHAENATVKGTIKASDLYIGDVKSKLSVNSSGYITLGSLAKTTNGNSVETNVDKAAGITVDSENGKILLSAAKFDSLGSQSSGIYITPTSVAIGTTGTFELKSTNFTVTTDGTIYANAGQIGATYNSTTKKWENGWVIGAGLLYSGAGDTYVALDSKGTDDYAIWCGNSDVSKAPFRVRRDGVLYAQKMIVIDDNNVESTIDNLANQISSLSSYRGKFIKSVSGNGTVTLRDGTTFNTAASVSINRGYWSSKSVKVKLSNNKEYTITSNVIPAELYAGLYPYPIALDPDGQTGTVNVKVQAVADYDGEETEEVSSGNIKVNTSGAYEAGVNSVDIEDFRSVTYTVNGVKTINPGTGKAGIRTIRVTVDVGGGGGGDGCFAAGSLVRLASGELVPIEDLKVGTIVSSYDEETKQIVESEIDVVQMLRHKTHLYDIVLSSEKRITLTRSHPVMTTNGWAAVDVEMAEKENHVPVNQLAVGDEVITFDGSDFISQIINRDDLTDETVYNLDVEPYDNFFVENVLVHNEEAPK